MTLLARGSRGPQVRALQEQLNHASNAGLTVDGIFGSATLKAVLGFQLGAGIKADGIVGKDTRKKLSEALASDNMRAFLDMIAYAEGTDRYGNNDGYDVVVGGGLFKGFDDHPNVRVWLPAYRIYSTAAGRYQILHRYWVHYKAQLKLPDFSPESQDRYAIQQIKERRAYDDVIAGRIESAITKCSNIWASFPGAGYGQREVAAKRLIDFYQKRGGILA